MKVKGIIPKKIVSPYQPSLTGSVDSLIKIVDDLHQTKDKIVQTFDTKISEVDKKIEESSQIINQNTQKIDKKVAEFEQTAVSLIKQIQNIPKLQGKDGTDGKNGTNGKDAVSIDENALVKKVISKIPENKASLKIIQEKFETDPMSVIEKIMALPDGKFKLKTSHIDGLEQTMRAFQSQLGRGYLHGGGDTVAAGTNITITTNTNGAKVINATGSGTAVYNEIVSGSGTTFTLANTPTAGTERIYGQGQRLYPTTDYTISGAVITTINSWLTSQILADYNH